MAVTCPLCGGAKARPSWLGTLRFAGRDFPYVECESCRSLYADPMPGEDMLSLMYGTQYEAAVSDGHGIKDPKERQPVVTWLTRLPTGTFLDYGCGAGDLLADVHRTGWRAMGVEFDEAYAAATARKIGVEVVSRAQLDTLAAQPPADVLHLGDVIEHLTDPDADMPKILQLIKPGGYLMAQGPLEANASLFTGLLKLARRLRGARVAEMAPYHILLATADGQQAFFRRFGLTPVLFSLTEVAWPAPARLERSDLRRPRVLGLYAARRLSQFISALRPARWGNRYFYVGHKG